MGVIDDMVPDYYYYVDPQAEMFKEPQPNPMENLLNMYQLNDIAKQVARYNEDGSRGVKLRKSYKNQVSDIAGHWTSDNIPTVQQYGDFQSKIFHYNNSVDPNNGQVDIHRQDAGDNEKLFKMDDISDYQKAIEQFGGQRINKQEINSSQLAFDFENVAGTRRKRADNSEGISLPGTVDIGDNQQQLRPGADSPGFKRRKLDQNLHSEG
ncbi:hypothetical protein QEN19_003423 [Hanseniaspora menglaensis]